MSDRPQADWSGERGGFDDFEYVIEESKFGYSAAYDAKVGANTPFWMPVGTAVLSDGKAFPGSSQSWKIGKGWDVIEDGAKVAREDGSELKPMKNPFHYNTGFATFVRAAIDCGAGEILNQRCGGDPANLVNAAVWVGLKFRLQRIDQGSFKNDQGQDQSYSMLLPTEFLGEVGGPAATGGATGSSQTSTRNGSTSSGDLEELAKFSADKLTFLETAIKEHGADISEAEQAWDKAHANA